MNILEKYRPKKLDDLILPYKTRILLNKFINNFDKMPNLLLSSRQAGLGKTSFISILKNMDIDYVFLNGSHLKIDEVRNKVTRFASEKSIKNNYKFIFIDEADGITSNQAQESLRATIEQYNNIIWVFTCNYKDKLIKPLQNRLFNIDFDEIFNNNKDEIIQQIKDKLKLISKNENIAYKEENVNYIIDKYYPSIRNIIKIFAYGNTENENNINFIDIIINQDFSKAKNYINEFKGINYIYDNINKFEEKYQAEIIRTLFEFEYKQNFVENIELANLALIVELMFIINSDS